MPKHTQLRSCGNTVQWPGHTLDEKLHSFILCSSVAVSRGSSGQARFCVKGMFQTEKGHISIDAIAQSNLIDDFMLTIYAASRPTMPLRMRIWTSWRA